MHCLGKGESQDCSHGELCLCQMFPHPETAGSEGVTQAETVLISAVTRVGIPVSCHYADPELLWYNCVCVCVPTDD